MNNNKIIIIITPPTKGVASDSITTMATFYHVSAAREQLAIFIEICEKERPYRKAFNRFLNFLLRKFTSVRGLFALAEYEFFRFRFLAKNCKKTKTSCTLFITCINRIIIKVCKNI